jgi:excisionase family DNA binding protein
MSNDIKVYTVPEVKDILHVSQRTIYNYITMGQLQAVKLGREWRVTEDALKDFLARGTDQNYLDAAREKKQKYKK